MFLSFSAGTILKQTCLAHKSPRKFSIARYLCENDEKPTDRADPDVEDNHSKNKGPETSMLSQNAISHSHRKAFCKWATTKGLTHRDVPSQPGTNYLDGKTYPFPLNPQFQPKPPISSQTKVRVYDDWKSGLGIQQLSMKYGISLHRVEAILKLHQVSVRWSNEVSFAWLDVSNRLMLKHISISLQDSNSWLQYNLN